MLALPAFDALMPYLLGQNRPAHEKRRRHDRRR